LIPNPFYPIVSVFLLRICEECPDEIERGDEEVGEGHPEGREEEMKGKRSAFVRARRSILPSRKLGRIFPESQDLSFCKLLWIGQGSTSSRTACISLEGS